MAETGDTIQSLALFLGVKCGKITYDGPEKLPVMKGKTGTRKGLTTICKHLVRAAEQNTLLGDSAEEQAAVDQWLEYRVCHVDRCFTDKDKTTVLQDLNAYLADKVYFLSHRCTLVDIVLYCAIHHSVYALTFYDKQKHMHLSRWFNNIQQDKGLRQSLPYVTFSRTPLYSGSAH